MNYLKESSVQCLYLSHFTFLIFTFDITDDKSRTIFITIQFKYSSHFHWSSSILMFVRFICNCWIIFITGQFIYCNDFQLRYSFSTNIFVFNYNRIILRKVRFNVCICPTLLFLFLHLILLLIKVEPFTAQFSSNIRAIFI
mgnify:CR=1 FL=1